MNVEWGRQMQKLEKIKTFVAQVHDESGRYYDQWVQENRKAHIARLESDEESSSQVKVGESESGSTLRF